MHDVHYLGTEGRQDSVMAYISYPHLTTEAINDNVLMTLSGKGCLVPKGSKHLVVMLCVFDKETGARWWECSAPARIAPAWQHPSPVAARSAGGW